MSRMFGLARMISEYARRRKSTSVQELDRAVDRGMQGTSSYAQRRALGRSLSQFVFGRGRRRGRNLPDRLDWGDEDVAPGQPEGSGSTSPPPMPPAAPPVQPPQPPRSNRPLVGIPGGPDDPGDGPPPVGSDDDDFDDIVLLGRDAGYHRGDWDAVMESMRLTPGSSNVYGYFFESEARRTGILYVTFLDTKSDGLREGPGPTYAYYDVSVIKANQFKRASAASAGNAVWDYLRIRGTTWGHQHQYRLVQAAGDYVPRKATPRGYRTRHVPAVGIGRRGYRRSTLPERLLPRPNDGRPDRGEPDRGN